jgi:hypothetical protein
MEMHYVSLLTCNYVLATCDIIAGDKQFTLLVIIIANSLPRYVLICI